jgi:hypothetical protein
MKLGDTVKIAYKVGNTHPFANEAGILYIETRISKIGRKFIYFVENGNIFKLEKTSWRISV